jgi:hypothetical protein
MKLRAFVTVPTSARRMAVHLGDPAELPPRAPARDPPFFKTRAVRRRLVHATSEEPLFTA